MCELKSKWKGHSVEKGKLYPHLKNFRENNLQVHNAIEYQISWFHELFS